MFHASNCLRLHVFAIPALPVHGSVVDQYSRSSDSGLIPIAKIMARYVSISSLFIRVSDSILIAYSLVCCSRWTQISSSNSNLNADNCVKGSAGSLRGPPGPCQAPAGTSVSLARQAGYWRSCGGCSSSVVFCSETRANKQFKFVESFQGPIWNLQSIACTCT